MARHGDKPWRECLLRSSFFVAALLVHLLAFALVARYVIFPRIPPDPDRIASRIFVTPSPPAIPLPPMAPKAPDVKISDSQPASDQVIRSNIDFPSTFSSGPVALVDSHNASGIAPPAKVPVHVGMSPQRRKLIRDTVLKRRTVPEILDHDPSAEFPVYVACYANGDWSCNMNLDADGNIIAGSIPNLVAKIDEWTHGGIQGHVVAKPLNIGGPELLAQMPPFVFFTGHKDFILTPQEIDNLQQYLVAGGAIWGDNALAGAGSRFDVAFHREMKRVVPDADAQFEPLTGDADIFKSHFRIEQTPPGMNYYAEPIEHLDLDGKLAILYTPDDYSDLYTMRILPGDQQILGTLPLPGSPLATSGLFLGNREVYFRNFTLTSSLAAHRLGLNIVSYLLTRFDDEILLAP